MKGGCSEAGIGLFTEVTRDASSCITGDRFDFSRNVFTEGVVWHWKRLPREVVESPSLEVFKKKHFRTLVS